MKYILVIGDGMADTALPQLAGKTPLEALALPAFDMCAGCFCGRVLTVPHGMPAGSDTAIRPTRIAVIGDATFVRNAQLESRANANRDLFLNCVSYLSGSHAITQGGADGELFVTGLDRRGRLRYLNVTAVAIPLAVMALMLVFVWRRRNRR